MFHRYQRLSARPTGGEASTGLGLCIVRKLVLAMNGHIACDSEPGRGAAFTLRLPGAENPQPVTL
jgi:signal transduction histidine kinase